MWNFRSDSSTSPWDVEQVPTSLWDCFLIGKMDRNIDSQGCCDNCAAEVMDETQSGYKFLLWVSCVRRGMGPACRLLSQSSHLSWPQPMEKGNSGSSKGLPHFSSKKTEKERPAPLIQETAPCLSPPFPVSLPFSLLLSFSPPSLNLFSEINPELAQSPTYHTALCPVFFSLYTFQVKASLPSTLTKTNPGLWWSPSARLLAATREAAEICPSTLCWSSTLGPPRGDTGLQCQVQRRMPTLTWVPRTAVLSWWSPLPPDPFTRCQSSQELSIRIHSCG